MGKSKQKAGVPFGFGLRTPDLGQDPESAHRFITPDSAHTDGS